MITNPEQVQQETEKLNRNGIDLLIKTTEVTKLKYTPHSFMLSFSLHL